VQSYDVVIVGGGLVGASLALALASADVSVALVEPHEPRFEWDESGWDSRIYTLSPGNVSWLTELGVWTRLPAERLTRVETMRVYGDRAAGHLTFSAYDAGLRELAWTIENRLLQREFWRALTQSLHVRIHSPAQCTGLVWERDWARLSLAGGEELLARLVVGADGGESWVREMAGIAVKGHEYGALGVVANFATGRPHEETAFQWFRHDGVLAFLPLPGQRMSMVWSTRYAHANELLAADARLLGSYVAQAGAEALGALDVITPAVGFPLRRQRVRNLVEPRVALVGDAAHTVHPLAGQGVNLGFRDARELASVLASRGPQRDCGDYGLLRRYERARWEDILSLELMTDGLEKLFGSRAVLVPGLRNAGLALVDAQPPLKNLFMRFAIA
jgi:ubiquinone biosynthesis UbiH/UbiF/VisC/COQ6 family hydroxylase